LNPSKGFDRLSVPTGTEGGVEKSISKPLFSPRLLDFSEFSPPFWGPRAGVRLRVSSNDGMCLTGETGIVGLRIDFRGSGTED
jgi:hypothetical protein